ncbi:hypothetical protein PCE1_001026 [Barthelona sp. PCE]
MSMIFPACLSIWAQFFINIPERDFSSSDWSISHEHRDDTVTPFWLTIVGLLLWICSILVVFYIKNDLSQKKNIINLVTSIFAGLVFNTALTNVIKHFAGRLRPDFLARCIPINSGNPLRPKCSNTDTTLVKNGRLSFPSGHSSTAAFFGFGLTYFFFYELDLRKNLTFGNINTVFLPTLIAIVVGVTRSTDYRHHPTDIVAGLVLGAIVSFFTFLVYYFERRKDEEHSPKLNYPMEV